MKKLLMLVAAIAVTGAAFVYVPHGSHETTQSCAIKFVELGYEETCRLYPDCCKYFIYPQFN